MIRSTFIKPISSTNVLLTRSFFNKSFNKTLLGRWNRSCDQSTDIKVNWANVDHCGTCSKEDLNKKYVDIQISKIHTSAIVDDDLVFHFDEFPELIKIEKQKKNTTGIDYFLTRTFM